MKILRTAVLVSSMFVLSGSLTPALALSDRPAAALYEQNSEARQEKIEDRVAARCANANTRLETIIARYNNNYPRNVEIFQRMKNRVSEFVDKQNAAGKDTSTLTADLKILGDKILKLDTDVKALVAQLEVAKQYNCGDSQGQFKEAMKAARPLAETANKDKLDVRNYWQTVVRPLIISMK